MNAAIKYLLALHCLLPVAAGQQAPAHQEAEQTAPVHLVSEFDLTVPLPLARAAALFGPEGERPWSGGEWDPRFVWPQPAHDQQGAVFTIAHGPHTAVWINTLFDLDARHFQYVMVLPDVQTATIDVRFTQKDKDHTGVHVSYARTALSPEANPLVQHLAERDRHAGPEWAKAIEEMLDKQNGK